MRQLQFGSKPLIMGILNVTPDSFSDGGCYAETATAVRHAEHMLDAGADLLDVGPESTRPGADAVPAEIQVQRAVPIIRAILDARPQTRVSIDTQSARVARSALDAGAIIVNDISALQSDPDMAALIADRDAWCVLMHMQGTPRTMQQAPHYTNVVAEVCRFLEQRRDHAVARGIRPERILLDPGIGFGKTLEHNLALLAAMPQITALGKVLLGTSRKSFIDRLLHIPDPQDRGPATEATHVLGMLAGVRVLRVHDVAAARQTVDMVAAISPTD